MSRLPTLDDYDRSNRDDYTSPYGSTSAPRPKPRPRVSDDVTLPLLAISHSRCWCHADPCDHHTQT